MNEIKCITKDPNHYDIYNRITSIWWVNSKWITWKLTQKEAIDFIKSKKYSFFVNIWWDKVNVIVSESRFWNEYIKTENDWDEPNNLLSLPECNKKINLFDFLNRS